MKKLGIFALAGGGIAAALLFGERGRAQQQPTTPSAPVKTHAAPPPPTSRNLSPSTADSDQGTEQGFAIFQQTCLACHGRAEYKQAPSPATLRSFPPEKIYDALTSGAMKAVGDQLTDEQRRLVSQALAGRLLGVGPQGDAASMADHCPVNGPFADPSSGPQWNGWGNSIYNTRFQSAAAAGLTAKDVPRLKLKWAFGLPNSTSSYSQPTVVSGRVFVGSDTGYVYSMDAKTGCVYWSYLAKAGVRNALTIQPILDHGKKRYAALFGDLKANVYAVDARNGELIWSNHVEDQYTDRVTAPPAYYGGRLFVPISSWEEFSANSLDYPCCTSVGAVVALNANTGQTLWKHYVIAERPHPVRKNSRGVQQYGPAGGSVWNTPAVDPKLGAIYFGTGDATTTPAAPTSDSVMALDMKTGRLLWNYQVTGGDAFLGGCSGRTRTDNCPKIQGPDWDIPDPPILTDLGNGRRMLVVGTKPGDVLALDPDHSGALLWRTNVNGKLAVPMVAGNRQAPRKPGIIWGGAVYQDKVYYGLTGGGGIAAMALSDGKPLWVKPLGQGGNRYLSYSAPATVIPGVVFLGGSDGTLMAVSTAGGDVLWNFATDRKFDTTNKVPAHGGAIGSGGVTVAGGMVFVGSGYSISQAGPSHSGNVVLAFATE